MGRKHTASEVSRRGNDLDKVNFTVRLAEVPISISAIYHSTKNFCRDYLTGEEPVFSLEVTPGDIAYERESLPGRMIVRGFPYAIFQTAIWRRLPFTGRLRNRCWTMAFCCSMDLWWQWTIRHIFLRPRAGRERAPIPGCGANCWERGRSWLMMTSRCSRWERAA